MADPNDDAPPSENTIVTWSLRLRADDNTGWPVVEATFTEARSTPRTAYERVGLHERMEEAHARLRALDEKRS
jgi:hypothetical protein